MATQLMMLGTKEGLPAKHGLLGRTRGYLSHGLIFLFQVPRLGKGGKEVLCICGHFKGLWDFNEDIKSLLLSLYNF